MKAEEHLAEAQDCLKRGWERFGNSDKNLETAALAAEAHTLLAKVIMAEGRRTSKANELIAKAESLLTPGGAHQAYGDTYVGILSARAYAILAEGYLRKAES